MPEVFRQRLGSSVGKQRAMFSEGHLLLVVHMPPGPDEKSRRGRLLWRDPSGQWRSSDGGSSPVVVRNHLDQVAAVIDQYEKAEDDATYADDYLPLIEGLAPLVRSTRNLEQVMQEARTLIPEDRQMIDLRDYAYEIARNTELLYTDCKNGMDIAVMRRVEQQAKSSEQAAIAASRFNLLVAFFFPIGVLAGLFGTNLKSGFEEIPAPVPLIALVMVGLVCGTLLALHIHHLSKSR